VATRDVDLLYAEHNAAGSLVFVYSDAAGIAANSPLANHRPSDIRAAGRASLADEIFEHADLPWLGGAMRSIDDVWLVPVGDEQL
jgi:hypothetical protein